MARKRERSTGRFYSSPDPDWFQHFVETRKAIEALTASMKYLEDSNRRLAASNRELTNEYAKLKRSVLKTNIMIMQILDDPDARHYAAAIMKDTRVHASHAYDKKD